MRTQRGGALEPGGPGEGWFLMTRLWWKKWRLCASLCTHTVGPTSRLVSKRSLLVKETFIIFLIADL